MYSNENIFLTIGYLVNIVEILRNSILLNIGWQDQTLAQYFLVLLIISINLFGGYWLAL